MKDTTKEFIESTNNLQKHATDKGDFKIISALSLSINGAIILKSPLSVACFCRLLVDSMNSLVVSFMCTLPSLINPIKISYFSFVLMNSDSAYAKALIKKKIYLLGGFLVE